MFCELEIQLNNVQFPPLPRNQFLKVNNEFVLRPDSALESLLGFHVGQVQRGKENLGNAKRLNVDAIFRLLLKGSRNNISYPVAPKAKRLRGTVQRVVSKVTCQLTLK